MSHGEYQYWTALSQKENSVNMRQHYVVNTRPCYGRIGCSHHSLHNEFISCGLLGKWINVKVCINIAEFIFTQTEDMPGFIQKSYFCNIYFRSSCSSNWSCEHGHLKHSTGWYHKGELGMASLTGLQCPCDRYGGHAGALTGHGTNSGAPLSGTNQW